MNSYLFDNPFTIPLSDELLNRLVEKIEKLVPENRFKGVHTLVSISGGSCTGKSSIISKGLTDHLSVPYTLLDQDTFQNNPAYSKNFSQQYRWDHPDNFAIDTCTEALNRLKNNKEVIVPDYSFKADEPIGHKRLNPNPVILLEGLYAAYQNLGQESDFVIYLESPFYARLIRRIFRNTLERYKGRDPALILKGFITSVTKAHTDFVTTQRTNADVVIKMPFDFSDLIDRFALKPLRGLPKYDWCVELADDLTAAITPSGFFTLIYKKEKYLEFEVDSEVQVLLKKLNWKAQ
ncbi:MAG: hypothetical protein AAF519_18800 [Bacteroidota bacterium]